VHDGSRSWHDDFPMNQEAEDFGGRIRTFEISCHETGLGFTVRAVESGVQGEGYEFAAYSETSPYSALYRVRQKMHRGLATRHIVGAPGGYQMMHDTLSGRISCEDVERPLLIVDGVALDVEDLSRMLLSREGWSFKLEIIDPLE
jgi:hypothetical protein